MIRWSLFVFVSFVGTAILAAYTQPDRGAWFKSLKQPINGASCCDVSDCRATEAEWRDGQWWAIVDNKWRAITSDKVVSHPHSIDGQAYICSGVGIRGDASLAVPAMDAVIFCFVPPDMGT